MTENGRFMQSIIENKDKIKEVYFSFGDFPNGRSTQKYGDGMTLYEKQSRQLDDLTSLANEGLSFNLLFNGNCYGKDSQSRAFFHKIGECVDFLSSRMKICSVTTSSPLIAKFIRENFDGIDVRASVNMEIGSIEGIDYLRDTFDSFYVKRECNRSARALSELRAWCDENGKQMYVLANSGCLYNCSAHTFHDNLVSHEAEIAQMDNGYAFEGMCHTYLKNPENREKWLQRTTFIRPEDVHLYEKFTPAVKLATRVNSDPCRVLKAYISGSADTSLSSLLEPDHSALFYPFIVENKKFPDTFGERVMSCSHNCNSCNYCKDVLKEALLDLGDM